jgi:hypothetical protein
MQQAHLTHIFTITRTAVDIYRGPWVVACWCCGARAYVELTPQGATYTAHERRAELPCPYTAPRHAA